MNLESITCENVRNLAHATIDFDRTVNLFLGDNGQGKTAVLEAIYFLATTRSFRTSKVANIARVGASRFFASGMTSTASVRRTQSVGIELAPQKRRDLRINAEKVSLRTYVASLQVFAYSAARLEIFRGGPEERRRFVDRGIASIDPEFLDISSRYSRVVKQRNALLEKVATGRARESELEAWDRELVAAARPLVRARRRYLREIEIRYAEEVARHHYHVTDLEIRYTPAAIGERDEEDDLRSIRHLRAREKALGYTLCGPHRDSVEFSIADRPAAEYLSSGEIKMAVLFLKLAKIALYRSIAGADPLFLLDDLDAELDLKIIPRLLHSIVGSVQLFTTSAKGAIFDDFGIREGRRFALENGLVTPLD